MSWEHIGNTRGDSQGTQGGDHLPFVLPTNIKNASGHTPATYTPHKHATSPPPSNQVPPPPPSHATASRGWILMAFRPRSCVLHLPRMQQQAGEMILISFRPRFPNIPESITSQCCMAVSIDTCTAVARFLSRFWRHTRTRVGVPPGFYKTQTPTRRNPYP